jgi:hypothetical protein
MRQQLLLHDPVALTIARRLTAHGHDVPLIPDAEIAYTEFTDDGMVRHPAFKRLVENQR